MSLQAKTLRKFKDRPRLSRTRPAKPAQAPGCSPETERKANAQSKSSRSAEAAAVTAALGRATAEPVNQLRALINATDALICHALDLAELANEQAAIALKAGDTPTPTPRFTGSSRLPATLPIK